MLKKTIYLLPQCKTGLESGLHLRPKPCGLTFLLIPKEGKDAAKTQTLKEFVQYVVSEGQEEAAKLAYAMLSRHSCNRKIKGC